MKWNFFTSLAISPKALSRLVTLFLGSRQDNTSVIVTFWMLHCNIAKVKQYHGNLVLLGLVKVWFWYCWSQFLYHLWLVINDSSLGKWVVLGHSEYFIFFSSSRIDLVVVFTHSIRLLWFFRFLYLAPMVMKYFLSTSVLPNAYLNGGLFLPTDALSPEVSKWVMKGYKTDFHKGYKTDFHKGWKSLYCISNRWTSACNHRVFF